MDVQAYKKAVDKTGTAQLTLTNKKDFAFLGNATQVLHLANGKLKFLWKVNTTKPLYNWYLYDLALLHVGEKIYGAYEIDGRTLDPETGKIELVFDYEI